VSAAVSKLAVLGLGLLGGSVGLAARRRGAAARVVGATRRADARRAALACGAVDEVADPEDAVRDAELVVLATPVSVMPELVRRVAPSLQRGAVVTDVGSVKAPLVETLPGLLPRGVTYVGAHPMAGSHERGVEHARADLFEGAPCVVTESPSPEARERVASFFAALGGRVVLRDAAEHDAEVAWMSHLPHVAAFAYARALESAPAGAAELAGSGFRDFTRIARSEPALWADILTANRKALAAPLQAAARALEEIARLVEAGDADAAFRWLAAARTALSRASREGRETRSDQPQPPAVASARRGVEDTKTET